MHNKIPDSKYKVGIAGFGTVGKRRKIHIDANPFFKTIAVSDISFSDEKKDADDVWHFKTYDKLFDMGIDVLFVCLPNHLAAEATIEGLKRGLHVFCEKPPGRTVEDIKNVISAEKENSALKLKYGFNHRYHYSVAEAKKIIDSEKYGKVVNIRGIYGKSSIISYEGGWRSERKFAGGGILIDQGIHMLDMIRYFIGDFREIKSFVSNDYWHHDVEDNAYAIMKSNSGCIAMLHSTATQWQHKFRLEISLQDALLELTGILSGTKSYGEEKLKIVPREEDSATGSFHEIVTSYLEDNSWRDEVNEFADIIVNNKIVENGNSSDALEVMKLVYRIYCSDEDWKNKFNITDPF
jgi:predicted dehydrogenase